MPDFGSPKYIHLNGEPVGENAVVKLLSQPAFIATAIIGGVSAVLPSLRDHFHAGLHLALPYAFARSVRYLIDDPYYKLYFGSRVINTKPSEAELVGSFKFRPDADFFQKLQLCASGGLIVSFSAMASIVRHPAPEIIPSLIAVSGAATVWAADNICTALRFNKIANGKWAIVDKPTEKQLEEEKEQQKISLPSLQPALLAI